MKKVKDGLIGPREMNMRGSGGYGPGHYDHQQIVSVEAWDGAYTRTSVYEFKVPN